MIIYPDYKGSDDAGLPWGFRFANETEQLTTFHSGRRPLPTHPYFKNSDVRLIKDLAIIHAAAFEKVRHFYRSDAQDSGRNLEVGNFEVTKCELVYRKPETWRRTANLSRYEEFERSQFRDLHAEAYSLQLAVPFFEVDVTFKVNLEGELGQERHQLTVHIDAETGLPMIGFRPPV